MWGELTDEDTKQKVDQAFKKNHAENLEVLIYKKSSKFTFLIEIDFFWPKLMYFLFFGVYQILSVFP